MGCFYDILTKINNGNLFIIVLLGIIVALLYIARNYYIGTFLQTLNTLYIIKYFFVAMVIYTVDILLNFIIHNKIISYDKNLFHYISDKILHTNFKDMLVHNETLLSNVNESIIHINNSMTMVYAEMIPAAMSLLATICLILYYLPKVAFLLIIIIICIYFVQMSIYNLLDKKWNEYWILFNRFNIEFQDVMLNMWNIKYNSFENIVNKKVQDIFKQRMDKYLEWLNIKIVAINLPSLLFMIPFMYSLYTLSYRKDIIIGIRIFLILQLHKVWVEFHAITNFVIQAYQDQKNTEKICPVWLLDTEHKSNKRMTRIKSIKCNNVSFGYADKIILKDLSFNVKQGETVSLVGDSGTGKSTIIYLLCRFYDIKKNNGSIEYNNTNIKDVDVTSLRESITVVPQQVTVFNISIKDNIVLDAKYNKSRLNDLIKLLHLPNENSIGNQLSQGQKQRVLIARALYRTDKSVYIFDEYLSAVNEKWATEIHTYVLDYIRKNKKIGIFISHNKEQMYSTDKIVNLK